MKYLISELGSAVVHRTGNETIAGVKTFTSAPKLTQSSTSGYVWSATGTDGSGGWVSASTASVTDGSITTAKLADGAATAVKVADSAITNAKVSASAAIALSKLAVGYVSGAVNGTATTMKIERMTAVQYAAATKDSNTIYLVAN